jgi:hypothetical protein
MMKQVDRERDSSITSSCREGSSSSSSSYSISEDEDERQPGFSFPVTPSFLRGEAARQAFSFSAFLFSGDAAALPADAHSLIPCVNALQLFSFQLFSFSAFLFSGDAAALPADALTPLAY